MKKLVFISDVIPDPEGTGSEQRSYSFLLAYSKICEVELWCHPRPDNPNARRVTKIVDLVSEIFFYFPSILSASKTMKALFLESLRQAHVVHMSRLPIEIKHPRIIWDVDELPPQFRESLAPVISESPPEELDPLVSKWVDFSKTCKLITCSSSLEVSPLMNNAMIIPNCYHSTSISIERRKSKVLLFVGHLGYPPNVEAIDYFYKNIFAKLPADFRFRIVGKKPTNRIYHSLLDTIASDPRVELHYDVKSCSPFYQDVFAAVVPLLQGSGTRLKILEAFAHGCPIISTSKGCEGHNVRDGVHLLIRDEVEDFALACEQLYRDDRLAASLAEAGLSFLKENNSQQALEELLYKQIDSQIPSLRKEQINGKFLKHNSIEWNSCTEVKVV